jgi:hypothetical protein
MPPHHDNLSQFHRQWRLIVQQLWNDDAAAVSVDDVCFAFLKKKSCRIEAGEYDGVACSRFDKSTPSMSAKDWRIGFASECSVDSVDLFPFVDTRAFELPNSFLDE